MSEHNIIQLGSILRESREAQGISIEKMAARTHIKVEHLINIETENFEKMPPKIFIKGIVAKYCEVCNLAKDEMLDRFDRYLIEDTKVNTRHDKLFKERKKMHSKWNFSRLFLILFLGLVGFFIVIQASSLLLPPKIEIYYPSSDLSSDAPSVEISGRVLRTKEFMINNQVVNVDKEGNFNYVLALESGVNNILIVAKNNWGKTSEILRKVIYMSTTSTTIIPESVDTTTSTITSNTTNITPEQ